MHIAWLLRVSANFNTQGKPEFNTPKMAVTEIGEERKCLGQEQESDPGSR